MYHHAHRACLLLCCSPRRRRLRRSTAADAAGARRLAAPAFRLLRHQEVPLGEVGASSSSARRASGHPPGQLVDGPGAGRHRYQRELEHPDPARYSLVWLSQSGSIRAGPTASGCSGTRHDARAMLLEGPLARPDSDGTVTFHTRWAPVHWATALVAWRRPIHRRDGADRRDRRRGLTPDLSAACACRRRARGRAS